ncbi:hypothetical protein TNCV_4068581 [Trichonephila clavipes]|nr:hypothetical protein TNCV_4068581 [Trichonephila clavipes]
MAVKGAILCRLKRDETKDGWDSRQLFERVARQHGGTIVFGKSAGEETKNIERPFNCQKSFYFNDFSETKDEGVCRNSSWLY